MPTLCGIETTVIGTHYTRDAEHQDITIIQEVWVGLKILRIRPSAAALAWPGWPYSPKENDAGLLQEGNPAMDCRGGNASQSRKPSIHSRTSGMSTRAE